MTIHGVVALGGGGVESTGEVVGASVDLTSDAGEVTGGVGVVLTVGDSDGIGIRVGVGIGLGVGIGIGVGVSVGLGVVVGVGLRVGV